MPTPHNTRLAARSGLAVAACLAMSAAQAQITFYEHEDFRGRTFITSTPVPDFSSQGFNDRASSVIVQGGRWQACQDAAFAGTCVVLRPGNYASLTAMGLNDRLSSVRPEVPAVDTSRAPDPSTTPPYAWRQRPGETLYQAEVTSVRAVVGAPSERCWVEHVEGSAREKPSLGQGVVGALIGGVLGHQIGGGTGRALATAGGAVAGGLVGANIGRDKAEAAQDVKHCDTVPATAPAYWDVGYRFRDVQHQVQMSAAPGATIRVNAEGEPRL